MTVNVPLQVALARQNLDRVVVGGVDGTIRVYDRITGELVHHLGHKVKGHVQVVDVSDSMIQHVDALTNKDLDSKHTRNRADSSCLFLSWSEFYNSTLAPKRITKIVPG